METNQIISELQKNMNSNDCNDFIKNHKPFIISTISKQLNRYISSENDEVFSIGLLGFEEAIRSYDQIKGSFF